jgi:hypothetical protein
MYLYAVIRLMLVFPVACVLIETLLNSPTPLFDLVRKWFVFWATGVRLFVAGIMQTTRPQFTSASIFGISDPAAHAIVREVGFGNLAMGTLGLCTLVKPEWQLPAALVGGLYYGLAGAGHAMRGERNAKEQLALVTDLAAFALLAAFFISRL